MEASAGTTHLLARWLVKTFGMAFAGPQRPGRHRAGKDL
jgi:hypothetical protein